MNDLLCIQRGSRAGGWRCRRLGRLGRLGRFDGLGCLSRRSWGGGSSRRGWRGGGGRLGRRGATPSAGGEDCSYHRRGRGRGRELEKRSAIDANAAQTLFEQSNLFFVDDNHSRLLLLVAG